MSMEFSRQEYWSGLPFSSLGDRSDPGIKPVALVTPASVGGFFTTSAEKQTDLLPIKKMQISGHTPDLQNQKPWGQRPRNWYFNKLSR